MRRESKETQCTLSRHHKEATHLRIEPVTSEHTDNDAIHLPLVSEDAATIIHIKVANHLISDSYTSRNRAVPVPDCSSVELKNGFENINSQDRNAEGKWRRHTINKKKNMYVCGKNKEYLLI